MRSMTCGGHSPPVAHAEVFVELGACQLMAIAYIAYGSSGLSPKPQGLAGSLRGGNHCLETDAVDMPSDVGEGRIGLGRH